MAKAVGREATAGFSSSHADRVELMGDGTGTVVIDGKMQDDATVKRCKVMVQLAQLIAGRDPEMKAKYGF